MTQDEIIRMAYASGGVKGEHTVLNHKWFEFTQDQLERFADLVAEAATKAERERCKTVLMAAHELSKQRHNYYHYIALQLDETAKGN